MIENGCTDYEIISSYPNSFKNIDSIRKARQIIEEEKVKISLEIYMCVIYGVKQEQEKPVRYGKYGYEMYTE